MTALDHLNAIIAAWDRFDASDAIDAAKSDRTSWQLIEAEREADSVLAQCDRERYRDHCERVLPAILDAWDAWPIQESPSTASFHEGYERFVAAIQAASIHQKAKDRRGRRDHAEKHLPLIVKAFRRVIESKDNPNASMGQRCVASESLYDAIQGAANQEPES